MSRFRYFKYYSLAIAGTATSTFTGSIIFADTHSDHSTTSSEEDEDTQTHFERVYRTFRHTFSWSGPAPVHETSVIEPTSKNSAHFISNLQMKDEYKAPKYPIILCHGLSGFDRLVLVPSFNLLSRFLSGKDLSDFSAIEDKGGLSLDYWFGIKEALESKGSTVLVAKVPGFGSIEDRAHELDKFIEKNTKMLQSSSKGDVYNSETETDDSFEKRGEKIKINLVAHSMGGLDCRYLISEIDKKNYEVVSLTTITTPHHGSEMADYCVELVKSLKDSLPSKLPGDLQPLLPPSIYQLTTSYMKKFNETVKDDPNVLYLSYGASFRPSWYNIFFTSWNLIQQHAGANDGMVSVESSKWGTYLGTLTNVDHLDLINWTSNFKRFGATMGVGQTDGINALALYLDIADNLAKRGF